MKRKKKLVAQIQPLIPPFTSHEEEWQRELRIEGRRKGEGKKGTAQIFPVEGGGKKE